MVEIQSVITKIDFEFNQRVIQAARNEVDRLNTEIQELQKNSASLDLNSTEFAATAGKVGDLTKQKDKLNEAIKKGDPSLAKEKESFLNMGKAAGIAKGAILALAGAMITKLAIASVQAAAQLEKAAASFEIYGLSASRAKNIVKEIDELSGSLPFESDEVLDVAKNLVRFGTSAKDVVKVTEQLAAIAFASGFSFESLSKAYSAANNSGKVFSSDFLKLYKGIPGIAESISKETGKTIDNVIKLGRSGKLSFDDFQKGLKGLTGETGKYSEALKKYQDTYLGAQKAFEESISSLKKETGEGILPAIKETFKNLVPIIHDLTPAFRVLGEVVGGVVSAVSTLAIKIIELPGKTIDKLEKKLNEFGLTFGGRFITKLTDKIKLERAVKNQGDIFGADAIVEDMKKGANKIIEGADEAGKKAKEAIKKLNDAISDSLFNSEQQKLRNDDLERFALQNEIVRKATQEIERLQKLYDEAQLLQSNIGLKIPKATIESFKLAKENIRSQAELELNKLFESIKLIKPLQVIIPANFIQFDEDKIKKEAKADLDLLINQLQEDVNKEQLEKSKTRNKPDEVKKSFIARLLGLDPKNEEIFNKEFKKFLDKSLAFTDTILQNEIDKSDTLINEAERRLSKLLSIQEGGNADQIKLEQERIDKLNEAKAKNIEKQKAFAAIQIATANAVSAAESVSAIVQAFSKGGNIAVGIASSLALIATIAATIAAVNSQFSSLPGFYEGAERISDRFKMTRPGRDGYAIRADGKERMVPGYINDQIPASVKNKDLPRLINMGLTAQTMLVDTGISREQKQTNLLLKQNNKLLKNQKVFIKVLNNGDTDLRLKRMRA